MDHGKSTLVQALTGINPDRLKQEQEREMTIDLGFAWLTLPHGETVSLVDVPGHEGFIKNMLAGVGGIDAALLVVASDEGLMPQTREHLAILDLLQVRGGVVALTKTDLGLDPDWLVLVEEEVRAAIQGTSLAHAELVPVSARTGLGLGELQLALERALAGIDASPDLGRPRLPIDRVFTMTGFGTVVTGTLSDGSLLLGEEVEILPQARRARVRGLQSHKRRIDQARPGGRVAVNLAGVATEDLARGNVLVRPDTWRPTTLLDARIEWLASAPRPLQHGQQLDLYLYASEVPARVRLLDQDQLAPGGEAWAQLVLASPVVAASGDRFVLRYASPSTTVGGGSVIEPHPPGHHKRRRADVIARLERAAEGSPGERVLQFLEQHPASTDAETARGLGWEQGSLSTALDELLAASRILSVTVARDRVYLHPATWARWQQMITAELETFHRAFPLRPGMPRQELKSRLNLPPRAFEAALARASADGILQLDENTVARAGHRVALDNATRARVAGLIARFQSAPFNPPSPTEAEEAVGGEVVSALVAQGALTRISPNVFLLPETVAAMQAWVVETIGARGQVTAAELRDHFQTSRKYAVSFLEYLDAQKVTLRQGDARVLRGATRHE